MATKSSEAPRIYQIKITLKNMEPKVWRQLYVPADITLAKLHQAIQIAMGWDDSHLHCFEIGEARYTNSQMIDDEYEQDEARVKLSQVAAPRSRFGYTYDFGDNWEHDIKIEKAIELPAGIKAPYCIAGEMAGPPEDSGGVWGYADMLETLAGPPCKEHAELLKWLGGPFDPQQFDLGQVNKQLKRLQK